MVTREQIARDVVRLVRIAFQHWPRMVDRFFSAILEHPSRLDEAIRSLSNICREQATAMVQAAREIGISDRISVPWRPPHGVRSVANGVKGLNEQALPACSFLFCPT